MLKYTYRGKSEEELKSLPLNEFILLIPSRSRRALKRGFTANQKKLLEKVRRYPGKFHRTKSRGMVIVPEMVGAKFGVHNGKEFVQVIATPEMLGHRLGEYSMTRRAVKHSSPGFGATKSSKYVPLK